MNAWREFYDRTHSQFMCVLSQAIDLQKKVKRKAKG